LSVTFVGYKSKEITLKSGQSQIKVELSDDAELLDEVVVVGYGTMKKRDLSGAVSQIKGDDLMRGNPADLSQGLAGKIAGVTVLPVVVSVYRFVVRTLFLRIHSLCIL
jgi:hypothetical protein